MLNHAARTFCSPFTESIPSYQAHSDVESDAFGTPDSGSRDLSPNWGEGGEGRDEPASPVAGDREVPLTKRALELNNLGGDAVRDTWELATGEGFEWQLDIDTPEVSVWSCDFGQDRRVLKSEGLVHVSPAILFHMLHENMAAQSSWNPIINRYEVVEKVDRYTDLTYTVTSAHAGGMVSLPPPPRGLLFLLQEGYCCLVFFPAALL